METQEQKQKQKLSVIFEEPEDIDNVLKNFPINRIPTLPTNTSITSNREKTLYQIRQKGVCYNQSEFYQF